MTKIKKQFQPQIFDLTCSKIEIVNSESESTKKKLKVSLMSSGWNLNDIYFSKEFIQEVVPASLQKPKIFVNHDPFAYLGRNTLEWAANIEECTYQEKDGVGQAIAIINFTDNPATSWLYDEALKDPASLQLSTHVRGFQKEGEAENRKGFLVTQLSEYKSTDIVPYGAAGGSAIESVNSLVEFGILKPNEAQIILNGLRERGIISDENLTNNLNSKGNPIMDIKTLAELKAAYPDLVAQLVEVEVTNSVKTKELETKLAQIPTLEAKIAESASQIGALEGKLTEVQNSLNAVTAERDAFKLKIDEVEVANAKAIWNASVEKALAESGLDEKAITVVFKETLMGQKDIAVVNSLITDRIEALKTANPTLILNGKVAGEKSGSQTTEAPLMSDEDLANALRNN